MERQHLSKQRWLELVEAQRASGLTVGVFCDRHGLAVSTFYGWKRRLKDEGLLDLKPGAAAPAGGVASVETPAFVEVTASAEAAGPSQPLELILPAGLVIRVPRGFDPDTLRQVVEALS